MDRFQYLALMAGCLLITLPLEFWLSARVYRRPRRMVLAVVPVALLFIAWDLFAIQRDHWTFSPEHTTGIVFPGGIPLEEVVFFLVIPICGLLTYEAVGTILRGRRDAAYRPAGRRMEWTVQGAIRAMPRPKKRRPPEAVQTGTADRRASGQWLRRRCRTPCTRNSAHVRCKCRAGRRSGPGC